MTRAKIGVYGMVPVAILNDPKVKPNMLRVYIALSSFQGASDKCWPSLKSLSERAGISINAVSEATGQLEKAGWIEKVRRSASNSSNLYSVLHDYETDSREIEDTDSRKIRDTDSRKTRESFYIENINRKYQGKITVQGYPVTESTHDQLVSTYTLPTVIDYYQRISDYVSSKGKKDYRDYAATARNWIKKDIAEGKFKRANVPRVSEPDEIERAIMQRQEEKRGR